MTTYEILTDEQIEKKVDSYAHDGFFHYVMTYHHELRLMICQKMIPEEKIVSTSIINNEQYGKFTDSKKTLLDIVAQDEHGNMYDIELQCYQIDRQEIIRFQVYGFRMVETSAIKGDDYTKVRAVRQMIINASEPLEGLDEYFYHFKMYDRKKEKELPNSLIEIFLVQLRYLDIEEDGEDFNQYMYLLKNNEMYDKIEIDRKIREVVIMHDEYIKSDERILAIQRERDRRVFNTQKILAREEGKIEGQKQQAVDMILLLLNQKFNGVSQDINEKLKNCSIETIHELTKRIFEITTEEEIKKILGML